MRPPWRVAHLWLVRERWQPWLTGLLLYFGAALLLVFNLDGHPSVYFNWEEFSAWGLFNYLDAPTLAHFAPTDGLMTNSGQSPLIVGPALLGWRIFGEGSLLGLRLPVALLAALAVPLTWRLGRRFIGAGPALLGALLLALSPVFLLYGRTATLVGISLFPALVSAWLLLRIIDRPTMPRVALLQLALIADGFAYGPLRFLWPIAVGALALEVLLQPALRRPLLRALLITALVLPLWLWSVEVWEKHARGETDPVTLVEAVKSYYHGRGEQVFYDLGRPPTLWDFATFIGKNGRDSLNLLLDRDTNTVVADFWNPRGRIQPDILVLPCLLGLAWVGWRARRSAPARLLLLLFVGFWAPLLLTSQVHAGRLIYVMPLLALLAAAGAARLGDGLVALVARSAGIPRGQGEGAGGKRRGRGLRLALAALLLLLVAADTWHDFQTNPAVEHVARDVLQIQSYAHKLAGAHRAAVLVLLPEDPESESAIVSGYRLRLEQSYRFVDLRRPAVRAPFDPADRRPPLLYGGPPSLALDEATTCDALYFVTSDRRDELEARLGALPCASEPTIVPLPR